MSDAGLKQLAEDEGFEGRPYRCTSGKVTIGYGFNLDDWPLSPEECLPILKARATKVRADLAYRIAYFYDLPDAAQDVLVNMGYQMGVEGVLKFKRTLEHLRDARWQDAADEMLNSTWAVQTPQRARRLADIVRGLGA